MQIQMQMLWREREREVDSNSRMDLYTWKATGFCNPWLDMTNQFDPANQNARAAYIWSRVGIFPCDLVDTYLGRFYRFNYAHYKS